MKLHLIRHIRDSIENGQWEQAKAQVQSKCKSIPERQSRRLAQVVGALVEDGKADDAVTLIDCFDKIA